MQSCPQAFFFFSTLTAYLTLYIDIYVELLFRSDVISSFMPFTPILRALKD